MAMATALSTDDEVEVVLPATAKQQRFLRSEAPNVVFQGGAGSGKTYAGVAWALNKAITLPGSRGMLVAPTHPQLQQAVMPHLLGLAEKLHLLTWWKWEKSHNKVSIPGGGEFFLRSADNPDALLGADLAWVVGDEVALWKRVAYEYLMGRLRQPGYPHQAAFTFTPKGRNWAYERLGVEREGLEIIRATTFDNPALTKEFHDRLRREYGEGTQFWRQEVLGEFVTWQGLVYSSFAQDQHMQRRPDGADWRGFVAGVDWGWQNPAAITVHGLSIEGIVYQVAEWGDVQKPIGDVVTAAVQLQREWNILAFFCDPSQPANIYEFQKAGLNAVPAFNSITPGISQVAGRIATGRYFLDPDCAETLKEFLVYSYPDDQDGKPKRDMPVDAHNHYLDTVRYAVAGMDGLGLQPDQTEDDTYYTMGDLLPNFRPVRIGAAR